MKKKVSLLAILLLVVLTVTACQNRTQNNTWQRVEQKKEIVVGLDDSFVPMGFVKKNGQLTGYDIDLAREVFKQYGIKVNFQTIDWSMNATELRNGTIDLIWNGYSITKQRQRKVAFSIPYLRNGQVLVVKKQSQIHSFKQMKNRILGMQTGSTAEQWYEGKQKVLHAKQTILYDQIPNAFLDLNANRIQGILLDEVYANYYIKHMAHQEDYVVLTNPKVPADLFAVGMRKGDHELKEKIDQALRHLQADGQLRRLNEKWFGRNSNYLGK
ncbi:MULTISPECIES: amino acid ABC transporter substrate-binding protein [Lactobacillus]|uniref:Amino acid ABC transporter substrate-binding protein n=1 Tax=Lactobacillus xujianguonis TaxID=2495899 RepID=A0A437SUS3_9LACO|nr:MULTISPECIES: amino acid ABC transporter substrate-binding protein [Lactobacillus]RVU70681.1 amino acid ABC transporter substrate-binding protein [Lactobacillus xujianguonis]RVU77146.1 amino acid ABC transporter substrate-binding protein [Lactobacillus xujianguonis]